MAAFLEVAHPLDLAPVGLVVDVGQHVQGLEDPPVVGQGFAELGGLARRRQHPDDVVGAAPRRCGWRRRGEGCRPSAGAPYPSRSFPWRPRERPVVGGEIEPPQLGVGQVGQLRAVVEAQQPQQPEHHVAVGTGVADDHLRPAPSLLAVDQVDEVQRVPRGARHHRPGQPYGLVVDQIQPRRATPAPEVLRVGSGVDAAHGHDEADAVDGGDQPASPVLGQGDVGLGLDQRAVGGGEVLSPEVVLVDVAYPVRGSGRGPPARSRGCSRC